MKYITSKSICELWLKKFLKSTIKSYSCVWRGDKKTVNRIIFKGSVLVKSLITSDDNAYTEVVDGTLNEHKSIEYTDQQLHIKENE